MTRPRQIMPGRCYFLTRRCTQRQFLLRPDAETNEIFLYCLAVAAAQFKIVVLLTSVMSNHHHTIVYDADGTIVEFTEYLHKLVARAMNALRGRSENFWSSEPPSLVHLVEIEDVIAKLVYAATNPVKDGLVERVHHWPGVNGYDALVNRKVIRVRRPRCFFRACGPMPKQAVLEQVIPKELGDSGVVRKALRERVVATEREFAVERRRSGKRVIGRRAVLAQSWCAFPSRDEAPSALSPRVAARSLWARLGTLANNRAFQLAYRAAREALIDGEDAVFPPGTYWLRRFAGVTVEGPPAIPIAS